MHHLSSMAAREQGLSRFIWSTDRRSLSVNGFPVHIPSFIQSLAHTISTVTEQINNLSCGYSFLDIFERIDQSMIPDTSGRPHWFVDKINNDRPGYSFLDEDENGFAQFRQQYLRHLISQSKLFKWVDGKLVIDRGQFLVSPAVS